jgi:diketogulonate reductase-like aldo/keto reductase
MGTWQYEGGIEPLIEAVSLGANFIDTAEYHGTEDISGRAIHAMRSKVFLATKITPRHFRRRDVIRSAEQSLRRLRTDYIDLYQLHWPNYSVPIAETMAAMEELVVSGKVRFIGVSNFSANEIEKAQASMSKSKIVSNQVRYNLVDRTIEDGLVQYCEAKKITILAYSPLAKVSREHSTVRPQGVLGAIAAATGKTRAQVALNWCTRHTSVIAIFKANSIEHVRENCGACGWRLKSDQLQALNQIPFQRRGSIERFARQLARHCLQRFGRNI